MQMYHTKILHHKKSTKHLQQNSEYIFLLIMIITEQPSILYSVLFILVMITLVLLFWTILDNKKRKAEKGKIPELKDNADFQKPSTKPRIIKSTPTKRLPDDLSLQNGISLLNNNKLEEAEIHLQHILDQATQENDLGLQCEARYYLAKLNKEMGDLTLACEHWQIARDLYKQSGNTGRIEEIEKDMRENGCPTDWVLNGF